MPSAFARVCVRYFFSFFLHHSPIAVRRPLEADAVICRQVKEGCGKGDVLSRDNEGGSGWNDTQKGDGRIMLGASWMKSKLDGYTSRTKLPGKGRRTSQGRPQPFASHLPSVNRTSCQFDRSTGSQSILYSSTKRADPWNSSGMKLGVSTALLAGSKGEGHTHTDPG